MWRVNSAKDTVPIGVVGLRAKKKVTSLNQFLRRSRTGAASGYGGDASASTKHFFIEQIGFGIFGKKAPPRSAAQERENFRAGRKFELQRGQTLPSIGGKHPL